MWAISFVPLLISVFISAFFLEENVIKSSGKMKRFILFPPVFPVFLILFSLFSCSHSNNGEIVYLNEETLRSATEEKEKSLQWTRELESVRLLRDISKNEAVSDNIKINAEVLCVRDSSFSAGAVYPFLPGFGSLDTSGMQAGYREFLESFCASVAEWNMPEDKFEERSLFSLALFKYDIENGWEAFFGKEFPQDRNGVSLFSGWIFGEPFFDRENIQTPVRFYCADGSVDVLFFSGNDGLKMDQIMIQRWTKGGN